MKKMKMGNSLLMPAILIVANINALTVFLPPCRYLHGCNILYELVKPWANTDTIVVADSYFASVQAALRLKSIGLRFIGTVKTATREFPMAYLSTRVMQHGRGDRHGVLTQDEDSGTTLLAFCWIGIFNFASMLVVWLIPIPRFFIAIWCNSK